MGSIWYGPYDRSIWYGPYHMVLIMIFIFRIVSNIPCSPWSIRYDDCSLTREGLFCFVRVGCLNSIQLSLFYRSNFILSCNSIKYSNKTFLIMIFICIQPKSVSNRDDHAFNEWRRSGTHKWLIEFFGRFWIKRFVVNF